MTRVVERARRRLNLAAALLCVAAVASAVPASAQDACTDCHDTAPEAFAETVHGFLECTDCHVGPDDPAHTESAGIVSLASAYVMIRAGIK